MYLSKILLDLRSPSVRQGLRNCEDMHRNVQRCFNSGRADAGVLYRLYRTETGCCVYVLSETAPTNMPSGMTLSGCRDMTGFEATMTEGAVFRFNLLCMPSKKIPDAGRKNSRRTNLRTPEERAAWLERKAAAGGFEIIPGTLAECNQQTVTGMKQEKKLIFHATQFSGLLRVTDSGVFQRTWRSGIGPEKAYGLGLLMTVR